MGIILDRFYQAAREKKRRVAIGALKHTPEFLQDLECARGVAEIVLVGDGNSSFCSVRADSASTAAAHLFELHLSGQVDAIVRGQLDYTTFHTAMNNALKLKPARHGHCDLQCPYLLSGPSDHDWIFTPMVQHDDAMLEGRLYLAHSTALVLRKLGIDPVIGVLGADNAEEPFYSETVNRSVREAGLLTSALGELGFTVNNYGLRIDKAVTECNVVIAPDGTIGNFVYRALGYVGGLSLIGGITLSSRINCLDTSRYNDRFGLAVIAAAGMANLGGMPVVEYADWVSPVRFLSSRLA